MKKKTLNNLNHVKTEMNIKKNHTRLFQVYKRFSYQVDFKITFKFISDKGRKMPELTSNMVIVFVKRFLLLFFFKMVFVYHQPFFIFFFYCRIVGYNSSVMLLNTDDDYYKKRLDKRKKRAKKKTNIFTP